MTETAQQRLEGHDKGSPLLPSYAYPPEQKRSSASIGVIGRSPKNLFRQGAGAGSVAGSGQEVGARPCPKVCLGPFLLLLMLNSTFLVFHFLTCLLLSAFFYVFVHVCVCVPKV